MAKQGRILWLDGLKGLACLGVFWHHFLLRYFPATYYGGEGAGSSFSQLPFWVVTNANFLVLVFFFCSGFVTPRQHTAGQNPLRLAARRYLRLAPTVWLCCGATYLLYKAGLLTGFDFGPAAAPSLRAVAQCGLWRILLLGDTTFSGAFWMLGQLFWAGLAALLLCRYVAEGPVRTALLAIGSVVCYLFLSTYCAALFWGAAVGCLLGGAPGERLAGCRWAALLIPGLFLGGYPSGRAPDNVYAALWRPDVLPRGTTSALTFQLLGVVLVFLALWALPALQKPLQSPLPLALGRLSYPIYVLHVLVICQLSDLLYAPLCAAVGIAAAPWLLLAIAHPCLLSASWACKNVSGLVGKLIKI